MAPPPRLTPDDVLAVVVARAARLPLSTTVITQWCEAAYGDRVEVAAGAVYKQLLWLQRHGRVVSYASDTDRETLVALGVFDPARPASPEEQARAGTARGPRALRRARYWMLADPV